MVSAYVISICALKVGDNTERSEVIFPYCLEKREGKNLRRVDWVG